MKKSIVVILIIIIVAILILFTYQGHIESDVMFVSLYDNHHRVAEVNLTVLRDKDSEWIEKSQGIISGKWYFKYGITNAYSPSGAHYSVFLSEQNLLDDTQYYIYLNKDKEAPISKISRVNIIKKSKVSSLLDKSYSYYLTDEQIDDYFSTCEEVFEAYQSEIFWNED